MSVIEREIHGSVVEQAATGDEVAFARIAAAYHDDVARVCFVACREVDLAQEAVQAAWPIAWRKLSTVRDPERLRPWLLAIAANEARQLMRRRGRRALREVAIDPVTDGLAMPGTGDPRRPHVRHRPRERDGPPRPSRPSRRAPGPLRRT